jgi:cell division protein FtsB
MAEDNKTLTQTVSDLRAELAELKKEKDQLNT